MQIQNEKGIYVYYINKVYQSDKDPFSKHKIEYVYYNTLEDFFRHYREIDIKTIVGYNVHDKICNAVTSKICRRGYRGRVWYSNQKYCNIINCRHKNHTQYQTRVHVVYDQNGNIFSPDRLIGLRRRWNNSRQTWYHHAGYKNSVWGGWRKPHSINEKRQVEIPNDQNYAPKPRARRNINNLPNSWDDYICHVQKSWKWQSKRKHQWKSK